MTRRKAILHIGTMKTGSTAIQNVFDKLRPAILLQGSFYPRSPGGQAHELLTYAAAGGTRGPRPGEPFWRGQDSQARLANFRNEFRAEMAAIPDRVDQIIISDERFSFYLRTREHIAALRDMVAPFADSFEVVAYLRCQDSLLASRYSEMLRVGEVGEPDHLRENAERLQDYDYRWLLDNWASVFGQDAVKPRIYERGAGKSFDSVADFMAVCGLDLQDAIAGLTVQSNPSMNAAGQDVLREVGRQLQVKLNAQSVGGPLWRRISDTVTAVLPGKGWLPTRAEAAKYMAQFEAGNEAVRQRYFPERDTLFADESGDFPISPVPTSDHDRFDAACAALLAVAERSLLKEPR